MSHGKALKPNDVDRIYADLDALDQQAIAVAKKYQITLETLLKLDRVRLDAKERGPYAVIGIRRHQIKKRSGEAKDGTA